MKSIRVRFLNRLKRAFEQNKRVSQWITALLFLELAGIPYYNPFWHLRNSLVVFKQLMKSLKCELRGYQTPIHHLNPEVTICKDFICVRNESSVCNGLNFTNECYEKCFGVKIENGIATSLWNDYYGNPSWLEVNCRDCTLFMSSCKGIRPKISNSEITT